MTTLKAATQNMRKALKDAGVKASVRMSGGAVQVSVSAWGLTFSVEEQRIVRQHALDMGFTSVRGLPIEVDRDTNPYDFNFYL